MGRTLTFLFIVIALAVSLTTAEVQTDEARVHDDAVLRQHALDLGIPNVLADIKTRLQTNLQAGSATITFPTSTFTNAFAACPVSTINQYCAGTVTYTASLAADDVTNTSTTAVNDPTNRQHLNDNHGTDPSGNPVYNALTYRIHAGLQFNGKEILSNNLDAELDIYDSSPIVVSLNTVRADRVAQSSNSVGFADTYCNNAALNCTTLNTGADTTVPAAQTTCYDQQAAIDPTLGNDCAPAGDPTASPHPHNNFTTYAANDGTNSAAAGAP